MSSSLQKMRESMKSKKTLFGSSKGKEVEALRDNLEQVGAQKVLHEQQAEMWRHKYAAMEKLVDHLELLVASQQRQLEDRALSPPAARYDHKNHDPQRHGTMGDEAHRRLKAHRLTAHTTAASDPDHVPGQGKGGALSPQAPTAGRPEADSRHAEQQDGRLFEYAVLLGARAQDIQGAVRGSGLAALQQDSTVPLPCHKLAAFPSEPALESLEDFCFPTRVPATPTTLSSVRSPSATTCVWA